MTPARDRLLGTLAGVPAVVAEAARVTPAREPAAGEWSSREVVNHLAAVEEEVYQARLRQMAAVERPHWEWVEPAPWTGPGSETLDGAIAEFARRRAATIESLRGLDDAGWAREGVHATLGVLDVEGLAREALKHDEAHVADLEARGET